MIKLKDLLTESSHASLYHGVKLEYVKQILAKRQLEGYSVQRWWPDGLRKKDDHPDYYGSYWMKGLSLTRDENYAIKWGSVCFELDQTKLRQQFKIIPYNWGYHIAGMGGKQDHKREREEFLVTTMTKEKFSQYDDSPKRHRAWREFCEKAYGKPIPLEKYCVGMTLSRSTWEIYTDHGKKEHEVLNLVMNDPLYKGIKGAPSKNWKS